MTELRLHCIDLRELQVSKFVAPKFSGKASEFVSMGMLTAICYISSSCFLFFQPPLPKKKQEDEGGLEVVII